jgi:alcohol dehydrogenase YqhD (iron-dependent ADH family)
VREGVDLCREQKVDCILAVGGGSVIDSAKAIAAGVPDSGDLWDFFMLKRQVEQALPIGVVLTIPGTGSESSFSTIITNEEGKVKKGLNSEYLIPAFAVLNPELTFTLTKYLTACGVYDAMTHVMERYFTTVKGNDCTDRLCEAVLKSLIYNGLDVLKKPDDYTCRAEIMWAAKIAHDGSLGVGRVGDFASHKIAQELGGMYDIAHGATLAPIFPAWMEYVHRHDLDRFVQFAIRVWNVEYVMADREGLALEGIQRLREFLKTLGLPVRLRDLQVEKKSFEVMAEKALRYGPIGNFVQFDKQDVINIFNLAY